MRLSSLVLIGLSIPFVVGDLQAQSSDHVMIARAAAKYALRDLSPRKLIVDQAILHGDSAVAGQIAQYLAGNLGRRSDHVQCNNRDPGNPQCSLSPGTVVIALGNPTINSDYAEVVVVWWYEAVPGSVAERMLKLALRRDAGSGWHITNELVSGRS